MKKVVAIVLLSWISLTGFTQHKYKNLVLEGGGVKGFAYVGAMEILDSLNILSSIERVGGTSAGAIQATMLAVGYTPAEIVREIDSMPLKNLNDGSFIGGIGRMQNKFGFYKGQKIYEWIEKLIKAKTGNADISFIELHKLKSIRGYKDLYITGTDLSYRCLRVFSYETYPNMRIKDALRISFSIPLYFEPVIIDAEGKLLKDRNDARAHLMVDGGLLNNYPIDIFDKPQYTKCNGTCRNMETLGLMLEKPDQLTNRNGNSANALSINTLTEYLKAVYQTTIDRPNPDEPGINRTIAINDLGIRGRPRKLPEKTIRQLIESGKDAVRKFFSVY